MIIGDSNKNETKGKMYHTSLRLGDIRLARFFVL